MWAYENIILDDELAEEETFVGLKELQYLACLHNG